MGVLHDHNNLPLFDCIVRTPYGGEETRSDPNGVFLLSNIIALDKREGLTRKARNPESEAICAAIRERTCSKSPTPAYRGHAHNKPIQVSDAKCI